MSEQCMQALERANRTRIDAARFRQRVASMPREEGLGVLAGLLANGAMPPHVGAMPLNRFLTSAHRIGDAKVSQIRREAGMYRHNPRLRDLTKRERTELAVALARRAK